MAELVLVAAVLSAVNSVQAGNARGRQLHLQGAQASLEGQQRALQNEQQANMVLQKLNETNAAARARGSAGGVQSFQGSAALIQDVNARRAGREFEVSLANAAGAERMGQAQMAMYASAANQAEKQGYFNAAVALASGGYQYGQIGAAPTSTATPTYAGSAPTDTSSYTFRR
jgi:hypothetical protein